MPQQPTDQSPIFFSTLPAGRREWRIALAVVGVSVAIFAAPAGVVYYPGRVGAGAILVALIASAMGGFQSRLAAFAVGFATVCWLAGMIISVSLERTVF